MRPSSLLAAPTIGATATEAYSAAALEENLALLAAEYPSSPIVTIIDAALLHRVSSRDRASIDRMVLAGTVVAPPAGCLGGVAAFATAVAERLDSPLVVSRGRFAHLPGHHRFPPCSSAAPQSHAA